MVIRPSPDGKYAIDVLPLEKLTHDEVVQDVDGIPVAYANNLASKLTNATVDVVMSATGPQFVVQDKDEPAAKPDAAELPKSNAAQSEVLVDLSDPFVKRIHVLIEEKINPSVAMHGGYV